MNYERLSLWSELPETDLQKTWILIRFPVKFQVQLINNLLHWDGSNQISTVYEDTCSSRDFCVKS